MLFAIPHVFIFVGAAGIESYKFNSPWQRLHKCDLASVQHIDSMVSNSISGPKQPARTGQIWSSEPKSHLDLGTITSKVH